MAEMYMKRNITRVFWLVGGLLALTSMSAKAINCQPSGSSPVTNTITMSGSFYAGNDIPIGTILYQANMNISANMSISCDGPAQDIPLLNRVQSAPSGAAQSQPVPGLNGDAWVYPTNIPGVGVAFWAQWNGNNSFSESVSVENGSPMEPGFVYGGVIRMGLIKTGPIDSGSIVQGSSLPTVIYYAGPKSPYTGLPATLATFRLQGSVAFITRTCQTPDVTVSMGTYEATKYFTGVGSTTPWKDASIQLQDCPTFTGYYGGYSSNPNSGQNVFDSGTLSGGTLTKNLLRVSLLPATNIIDPVNGVLEVNANGSSGSPATGVGIQLGYTPDNVNASPTNPTTIWHNGDSWSVAPPNDGSANFRIPLAARYYQYNASVTPGPANSQVTFVIDYN